MKFKIDEKTGMIVDADIILPTSPPQRKIADSSHLEQILQAVKKTQNKILNREIQSIQDSKNIEYGGTISKEEYGGTISKEEFEKLRGNTKICLGDGKTVTFNEIEQNQKIREKIIKMYNFTLEQAQTDKDVELHKFLATRYNQLIKTVTGKDIKDYLKKSYK